MTNPTAIAAKAERQANCLHDFPKWRKARLYRYTWARRCRVCRWTEYSAVDPSSLEAMAQQASGAKQA